MIKQTTKVTKQFIQTKISQFVLGSVLVNPGGPGGSGTDMIGYSGHKLSTIVGPEFDIIGFDPRGTGATTPQAQCFPTSAQFQVWNSPGNPLLSETDGSVPVSRSRERVIGELCHRALGGNGNEDLDGTAEEWAPGRFMSTASVATDMLHIVEKLGQQKLQYWGFVRFHLIKYTVGSLNLFLRATALSWDNTSLRCILIKSGVLLSTEFSIL